jgi:hypothetical protein
MVVVNTNVNVNLIYLQMRVRPAGFELQAWRLCKPQGSIGPEMGPPVRDRLSRAALAYPFSPVNKPSKHDAKALVKKSGDGRLRTFGTIVHIISIPLLGKRMRS